jgi:hypothetical protein
VPPCQEDDPCWDCGTMGNLQCGPVTTTPTIDVVVPPTTTPVRQAPAVLLPETR